MTVALVHYHFRPGGVTRVLEAQSSALQSAGVEHVILSGTPYEGSAQLPVLVVPDLDYRTDPAPDLASTLLTAATNALGEAPNLWHLHNPTLGKNAAFPELIASLLDDGHRLVFQHHDFAEDGRPDNYQQLQGHSKLYPLAPQAQYACINSRDRSLLIDAGLPADRCHLLPNAVTHTGSSSKDSSPSDQNIVLYSVRGIRRKNIGELCLLAALAPANTQFAQTLAPENPHWKATYDEWVDFAQDHNLPVLFGVAGSQAPAPGASSSYESWLLHATHLMTCSVAEGFGLAFLEPIAINKPLLGRDLPEITDDFKKNKLKLGSLYDNLLIPLDWIDQELLHNELEQQLGRIYESYGQSVDEEILDRAWDALLLGDYADFGNLPEPLQRLLIAQAVELPDEVMVGIGGECQPLQDWLEECLMESTAAADSDSLTPYGLPQYSKSLLKLYRSVLSAETKSPDWLAPSAILEQFLEPERFHFLRT